MKKTDKMCSLHGNYPGVDVIQVKLVDLHAFKNHPFKVEKDQALFELRQSIKSEGILVVFCELSGDKLVTKGTYAKMARGEMVRFIAENNIENPVEIQKFDRLGYSFRSDLSSDSEYVFEREIK